MVLYIEKSRVYFLPEKQWNFLHCFMDNKEADAIRPRGLLRRRGQDCSQQLV